MSKDDIDVFVQNELHKLVRILWQKFCYKTMRSRKNHV